MSTRRPIASQSQRARRPKPRRGAEIILKESYTVDATGRTEVPIPELILLADKQGLRYLGEYFLWLADTLRPRTDAHPDPDDHQHSGTMFPDEPFNHELSDRIELRIGIMDKRNRRAVLTNYGVKRRDRKHGSLVQRYRRLAEVVEAGDGAWGGGGYSTASLVRTSNTRPRRTTKGPKEAP